MHYLNPDAKKAYVVLFYRDFKDYGDDGEYGEYGYDTAYRCHRGLGVNALHTAKVLRKNGIRCDLASASTADDVRKYLQSHSGVTHAVIQALWIKADAMGELCTDFGNTQFIVRVHSQIGFLQVEPRAIHIMRDLMFQQELSLNLTVSANSSRLQEYLHKVYKTKILYLPNLYDLERVERKRDESHSHRLLRVGSFGAHRLLKNHTTAGAAAMMMARRHGCDLEFYINSGRHENTKGDTILHSLRNMFHRVPGMKLIESPWAEWSEFRQIIAYMDLCLQVSFTETFNIVTADAVAEGVPSVVSSAIEWAPDSWQADVDNADDIARTGAQLLWDKHAAEEGFKKLSHYCKDGVETWLEYLGSNPTV